MYVPKSFEQTDIVALQRFMERNSFATLVSMRDGEPFASHLPLLLDRDGGSQGRLVGHMAKANPQWRDAPGQPVRRGTIPGGTASVGDASEHECGGERLRQCVPGVVLRDGEDGAGAGGVRERLGGGAGDRFVRRLLQRRASSFVAGVRVPGRVRETIRRPEIEG